MAARMPESWCRRCGWIVVFGVVAFAGTGNAAEGPRLTLPDVARLALATAGQGALARARFAEQRAQSAVHLAQGAFDWNVDVTGGYRRVALSGSSGGFLTTDIRFANILATSVTAAKLLDNGIRIRPGLVMSNGDDQSRLASEMLRSQPLLQVEVPVDGSWGQPLEALRLNAARSELAATRLDGQHARQLYLSQVMKSAWALLATQQKYAATLSQAAVAEEIAARMLRLTAAREVSQMASDDVLARAQLRRNAVDQAALELSAARLDLALLLRTDEASVVGLDASFPAPAQGLDDARLTRLVDEALSRRLDLQGESQRIESAHQRARIAQQEVDSRLTLQAGHDRLLLNWSKPLGENRDLGAREQALAEVGQASLQSEDLRRHIEVEVRMAHKRLLSSSQTIERMRPVVEKLRDRFGLVRQLVDQGQQPPPALLDAADQLSNAQRQLADLELLHAETLADLHLATASISNEMTEPAMLARAFSSLP